MPRTEHPDLPPLLIRVSPRARRLSIRVSASEGVVVVVPRGTPRSAALRFVRDKRDWLARAVGRLEARHGPLAELVDPALPEAVRLPAVDRSIPVSYASGTGRARCLRRGDAWHLVGPPGDRAALRRALQRRLAGEARVQLEPWLLRLSDRTGLRYGRLSIRGQRTLWGSCSRAHNISLNWKLLFLPAELVEYVLLHELVHTVHRDHSPRFWDALGRLCPEAGARHRELRRAPGLVPAWAERRA
ncbi:MAG TPA: SprT family zinc-dependent metalloprotease [Gammaproteobacteria bacterium]|nr:SprT family zinc-dependent metalloprotease [Gammaproteobacteria bacterium]